MKLCPQCEFLYEDDQGFCDMDGEGLVYDTRAGVFPDAAPVAAGGNPKRSRPQFMLGAMLAGLILSALLSFAYFASTRSNPAAAASPSRQTEANQSQQIAAAKVDPSLTQPVASPSQSQTVTEAESPSTSEVEPAGLSESQTGRTHTVSKARNKAFSRNDSRLTISKRIAPLPQLNPLPQLLPLQRLPAAKPTAMIAPTAGTHKIPHETTTETSQKSLIVEVNPPSRNMTKRSKVGAFFKKTGRMLTKPFKH